MCRWKKFIVVIISCMLMLVPLNSFADEKDSIETKKSLLRLKEDI